MTTGQASLFGGRPAPPIEPPWSIWRCRQAAREVGGYRNGSSYRTTFGFIRPDGVYQRGTQGIAHMLYRGNMSYGTEEWRASEECRYLVTVDNLDRVWWWIGREEADREARVDETYTGHRILVPHHLHGEMVP